MQKAFSIIGLVLGILGIVFFWFPIWNIAFMIMAIVGLVLSIIAKKKAGESGVSTGLATAALVLSIIGVCLSVIGVFSCTLCLLCAGAASEVDWSSIS